MRAASSPLRRARARVASRRRAQRPERADGRRVTGRRRVPAQFYFLIITIITCIPVCVCARARRAMFVSGEPISHTRGRAHAPSTSQQSISPISPYTTVMALLFVLGVSMVKEAIEDYVRSRPRRRRARG